MHTICKVKKLEVKSWLSRHRIMSDISKNRHAKLGCVVVRLFPKVMQMILKEYITPKGLTRKYSQNDFHFVFEENEAVLMDNLPNMDDFTIDICYKILRFENWLDEPKCKWGNIPHGTEVEIADDIQRLINATNSIISIKQEDVTENYYENMFREIKYMVTRFDSYFGQDTFGGMFDIMRFLETDSLPILTDLSRVNVIEVLQFLPGAEMEKKERFSRLSMAVIDTFPDILRFVLRSTISPPQLYLQCSPYLKEFYSEQQVNITNLQYSNTYSWLDVSLIYKLLRQFSLIQPPTQGWGPIPNDVNIKLGDDIERIRCYRNHVVHRCDTNIDKDVFDDYFDKFRDIGHRMDIYFCQKTNYEQRLIWHKTRTMDTTMQAKYENAMKAIENIKIRFEKRPIKFYWGESFDKCLKNIRSLLKDEQLEGRQKIRVQIIFQNEDDVERNIDILNSLKDEINAGLSGIEFIVAKKGSIVLDVNVLLEILETDEKLQTTFASLLEKILECTTTFTTETIDMVLLHVDEYTHWNQAKTVKEPVYLDFDIEAQLFETDDIMKEQFGKISDVISKRSNGSGTNNSIIGTILPIYLEYEDIPTTTAAFIHAQTPVKYILPVSVNLRKQLNIKQSKNENPNITSCIKTGNTLVFVDYYNKRLIVCNSDGTNMHHILLSYLSSYITEFDSDTVAVSFGHKTILLINIYTGSVTSTINTNGTCRGISYYDNNLYGVTGVNNDIIHVMDVTGKVIRTIPLPSHDIRNITVDSDMFVCINFTSIYCCSLDGTLIWTFEKEKFQDLRGVTTDNEWNVYVTDYKTDSVVVIFDNGNQHKEILTKSDGLNRPCGIYFDKKEKILLVCNDEKVFLFDVENKRTY